MKTSPIILLLYFTMLLTATIIFPTSLQGQSPATYAVSFDGDGDYASKATTSGLGIGGSFTIELWVKADPVTWSGDANCMLLEYGNSWVPGTYQMFYEKFGDSENWKINFYGYTETVNAPFDWDDGAWHHLAGVFDEAANTMTLYKDGVQVVSGAQTATFNSGAANLPLNLGRRNDGTMYADADMTEVRIWNTARSASHIRDNMYTTLAGNESGLIACYKTGEGSGSTLDDATTHGNDLTLYGGATWVNIPNPYLAGIYDGANDYIDCGDNTSLDYFSGITVEAWVKVTSYSQPDQKIIGRTADSFSSFFSLSLKSGQIYPEVRGVGDGSTHSLTAGSVPAGVWTHVAFTYASGASASFIAYVNGVEVASVTGYTGGALDFSGTAGNLIMGAASWSIIDYLFYGQLDEVRVWNEVRSASEIQEYMCRSIPDPGNELNLVAYYTFNNIYTSVSTYLPDVSGTGNTGTLVNFPASSYTTTSTAFNTWMGHSTTWSTASNWSSGAVPAGGANVGIYSGAGSYPSIAALAFNNLVVGSGLSTLSIAGTITINKYIILNTDLNLNGWSVYLGATGTLAEGEGEVMGNGWVRAVRTLNNISNENVGGLGLILTTTANMGSTLIDRFPSAETIGDVTTINRRFYIGPTNNTGLNATMVFTYKESELNGIAEDELRLVERAGGGYYSAVRSVLDTEGHTITLTDIDAFSERYSATDNIPLTIYANTTTGDDANNGSSGSPVKSFHRAYSLAVSGDALNLSGTFDWTNGVGESGDAATTGYTLAKDLTITGQGVAATFIQAGDAYNTADRRVFTIGGNYNISFEDLTIRYGKAAEGGGIWMWSSSTTVNLTIDGCNLSYNNAYNNSGAAQGGGLYSYYPNGGTLTITQSTISNNDVNGSTLSYGGGIFLRGTATITESTFSNNAVTNGHGGGVYGYYSALTMTNTTLSGNSCTYSGGGVSFIFGSPKINTFSYCTFSNNSSTQGGDYTDGIEVSSEAILNISNCLVGGNGDLDVLKSSSGTINDDGYNIVEVSSGYSFTATGDITGDQPNLFGTGVATRTLADNGGPTQTLLVGPGSVAIGAGIYDPAVTTDQRGASYPRYNPPTIGAYEYGGTNFSWDGSESTDWNTAANWSTNQVPTAADNISIYAAMPRFPVIESGATGEFNGITLEPSTSLTVAPGASLIVNGNIINAGTFNIERSITGHGGVATAGWHLISSPVADQLISTEFVDVTANPMATTVDLYRWSEPEDLWINIKNGSNVYNRGEGETYFSNEASPTFTEGKGYLISYQSSQTKTFSGTPNTSSITWSNLTSTDGKSYQGYHLLGNPFPCALQWNPSTGNAWALSNVNANAHIWNANGASYTAIQPNDPIPSMQGFMVYVGSGANSITIPTGNRVHNSTAWMKSAGEKPNQLMLTAHDPEGSTWQQTIIGFNAQATEGFDMDYDAGFLSGYAPLLYSVIDGYNLSVNIMPELSEERVIPLGFAKNSSSQFYLEAQGIEELNPQATLFLYDAITSVSWNLSKNPVYVFTASDSDPYDRFELRFGPVGVDEAKELPSPLQAWYNKGLLYIPGLEGPARVSVYSLSGQCLETGNVSLTTDYHMELSLPTGLYVVRVVQGDGVKTAKVLAR